MYRMLKNKGLPILGALAIAAATGLAVPQARADFIAQCNCSDAFTYGILYEGAGGNTLNVTNDTITGNIGIGGTGKFHADSSQSVINGALNFSAANTGQDQSNGKVGPSPINFGVTQVQTDLNALGTLSSNLGAESGTSVAIHGVNGMTQTINAGDGMLDANGNRVFTVSSFSMVNNATLDIQGDAAGDSVVLNIPVDVGLQGNIILTDGLTADKVLFNIIGGTNLMGGPTLNGSGNAVAQGDFLDVNGPITPSAVNFEGRLFGGDTSNLQFVSGTNLTAPVPAPLIGHGLLVLLAVGSVLSGSKLLESLKKQHSHAA
jgi:hypothetical protein